MRPFFSYYGAKWRAAPRYPAPQHDTIIEPFAGAAGYSVRHNARNVLLVDKSPVVVGTWEYLISTSADEIRALPDIPDGGTVNDLDVCQEARWLMGWNAHPGDTTPALRGSSWSGDTRKTIGWGARRRETIASQVDHIRHWSVVLGEYRESPDIAATWFVDPPYDSAAGRRYKFNDIDYSALADWCTARSGQVIVCDQYGADWLPFRPLFDVTGGTSRNRYTEVVWTNSRE